MPFTCEECGRTLFPDLIPAVGNFRRSMLRLAHELAQNHLVVVYFSVMLPEQLLVNSDMLGYFDSVHFLCLTCPADVLRSRLARRDGDAIAAARTETWVDFNTALMASAARVPTATVLDAGRILDDVENDVRGWIDARVPPQEIIGSGSLG